MKIQPPSSGLKCNPIMKLPESTDLHSFMPESPPAFDYRPEQKCLFLLHRTLTGSGAHPTSYPIYPWGSFGMYKVAGA
jgi:hypothetical protein